MGTIDSLSTYSHWKVKKPLRAARESIFLSNNNNVMKFICPLLAALTAVIALFGPWFTRTTQITGNTIEDTLLDVLQGNSFVEYTSSRWIWISGVGLLLVLASAVVNDQLRKKLAEAGSYLMVILPGWSLFQVYVGDEDFSAGWGMWAVAAISVAVIVLARMIPEEKPREFVTPQMDQ